MFCPQEGDAGFQALIERINDDYRFIITDELICDMGANIASATCEQPSLGGHYGSVSAQLKTPIDRGKWLGLWIM